MSSERNALPFMRAAVTCALVGLSCVTVFLRWEFSSWSVGIGIGAGVPLTLIALLLYLLAVIKELRRRGEL